MHSRRRKNFDMFIAFVEVICEAFLIYARNDIAMNVSMSSSAVSY